MGSRYGGSKQIDPVGPGGEFIIHYSIYDAIRAGFGKVVFVIRHDFEDAFREGIGNTVSELVETDYAYQELDSCLGGFAVPADRRKPWGTGHAVLVGREVIDGPFAVINADDFYGAGAYREVGSFLENCDAAGTDFSMVGYILNNTLSEYGSVCRGICECDDEGFLQNVTEVIGIEKHAGGAKYPGSGGQEQYLSGSEIVSMNLWGFTPAIFDLLAEQFADFLKEKGDDLKAEFFLPAAVNEQIHDGKSRARVLTTDESWFGMTYQEDKAKAVESIAQLVHQGVYPKKLWD
jgi:UTP-glucose-1-phosphate uridylyltransferase